MDREEARCEQEDDEDEEDDADFDPLIAPDDSPSLPDAAVEAPGTASELPSNAGEEEGCVVDNDADNEDEEEEYDVGFLELGSEHEDEEDEEDEDEDEDNADDDGEVDDEVVVEKKKEEEVGLVVQEVSPACAVAKSSDRGKGTGSDYGSDEAECSSPHEDELMGNALEALPELHSPAHDKYMLESQAANSAEDEEVVMDAISKRTRAHYSLTDMTLDQLETFLQESDEDDYFHNVDDEEEYRKFLAAVAQPDTAEGVQVAKDGEEDEDEDDADFEIEIEEALESDLEQFRKEEAKRKSGRRPETREQRRERLQNKERPLEFAKHPLRPLVPYHVIPSDAPTSDRTNVLVETSYRQPQLASNAQPSGSCFSAHQIAQLHCLIHEHVQLLVQVFSLCILEPSRQQVAIDTHRMLMELVNRRDLASFRKAPFPDFCFRSPYVRPSVHDQSGQTWVPSIKHPVHSVLSVAPLNFVKEYLDDVAAAVQEYKQRHVQTGAFNSRFDREPLFPIPENTQSKCTARGSTSNGVLYQLHSQTKKTMAAILVENTKKQIIALVPKGIVTAASRFIPFFNPALFPHKAPPPATANRLLFTDAEDELLAMGLMTFNTDWNAIQQRFLPTKSTHQIFVRQKNRSSSRAPENSIKAVRRMKSSPLTLEERESIQEALRCFKYDWNKVWQHAVPHRDPALLPRQWRTALGTQKSYKSDEVSKGKRRLHEASKRRMKALNQDAIEPQEEELAGRGEVTNSEDEGGDYDEAHIHQAFLSDWRPEAGATTPIGNHFHQQAIAELVKPGHPKASDGYSPRKRSRVQTVKLAPGLPSLNLPPHVRIISQSTVRSTSCETAQLRKDPGISQGADKQDRRDVHPLLLQPSYYATYDRQAAKNPFLTVIRPPSSLQRNAPAFHPFFGPKPSASTSTQKSALSFHPLLQEPLSNGLSIGHRFCGVTNQETAGPKNKALAPLDGRGGSGGEDLQVHKRPNVEDLQYFRAEVDIGKVNNDMDIVMEQEELSDSKDEADPDLRVQFECEEIGDSDNECSVAETRQKEIEFEEEEIDSENESLSEQARPAPTSQEYRGSFEVEHRLNGSISCRQPAGEEPSNIKKINTTNRKTRNTSRRNGAFKQCVDKGTTDVTAIEAAEVLAVIHQNPSELRKPF